MPLKNDTFAKDAFAENAYEGGRICRGRVLQQEAMW